MDIPQKTSNLKKIWVHPARIFAALGLLLVTAPAFCDEPLTMAPPIQPGVSQSYGGASNTMGADSVFNWTEVPQNQQVPIRRVVFDQGGYQIYDTVGETIVVPFTNQNLYVMKFGQSSDGTMYFVNDGAAPTLYIPRNGYLENAAVPGARWYPFSEDFHPSHPVFLGCAPSWNVFVGMGWYPDMICHGGYYCDRSFLDIGFLQPTFGLFIEIGGRHYDGWNRYRDYCDYHPAPYRVTVVNNYFYDRARHPEWGGRPFAGTGHPYFAGRPNGSDHSFGGRTFGDHSFGGDRTIGGDHPSYAHRTFNGGLRTYGSPAYGGRTDSTSGRPFGGQPYGGQSYGNGRVYQGSTRTFPGGQPANSAGRGYEPGRPADTSNGRIFSGRTYNNSGSSGRSYGGSDTRSPGGNYGGRSDEGRSNNSGGFHGGGYRSR